jgi:hypothetical protein
MVKEDPDGVDYHHLGVGVVVGGKDPDRIPVAASSKRPTKKKPKDKPKRPLSAYNFFFKCVSLYAMNDPMIPVM